MNRSGGGWRTMSLMGPVMPLAPEPCAWENLLRELELCDEDQALASIQCNDARGARIVTFVRGCFHLCFIPEPVLAELNLQHAVESCFDNRNLGKHLPKRRGRPEAWQQGE
jgi:hypothetical protein